VAYVIVRLITTGTFPLCLIIRSRHIQTCSACLHARLWKPTTVLKRFVESYRFYPGWYMMDAVSISNDLSVIPVTCTRNLCGTAYWYSANECPKWKSTTTQIWHRSSNAGTMMTGQSLAKRSRRNSLRHLRPLGLGECHPYSKASEERILSKVCREPVQLLCDSIAGLQTSMVTKERLIDCVVSSG